MARIVSGSRLGATATLRLVCSAAIFDDSRLKLLLMRRSDGGVWCLPGGGVNPGESVTEACCREVREETGLTISVRRLIGVYSDPNTIVEYEDGNRFHVVALNFEAVVMSGNLQSSLEATDHKYVGEDELDSLELISTHRQRILDAFSSDSKAVFLR